MADDLKLTKGDVNKFKNGIFAELLKKKGYKINSILVMVGSFLVPVGLILYLGFSQGWGQKWSVNCPSNTFGDCMNPFYSCDPMTTAWCPDYKMRAKVCVENPGFCTIAVLKPGESYGHKKGVIEQNFGSITLFFVAASYGLNHLLYNSAEQRKKRKEEYQK